MSEVDVKILMEAYRTGDDHDGGGGTNVRLVPFDEIKENSDEQHRGLEAEVARAERFQTVRNSAHVH